MNLCPFFDIYLPNHQEITIKNKTYYSSLNHSPMEARPIINAHTHVFTHEHVPPLLAKRLLPWPFYYLLPINTLINFLKKWVFNSNSYYNRFERRLSRIGFFINQHTKHHTLSRWLIQSIEVLINATCILFVFSFFAYQLEIDLLKPLVNKVIIVPLWLRIGVVVISVLLLHSARRTILLFLKNMFGFLKYILGPQTIQLINRYLSMAYYDQIDTQENIFDKLHDHYPDGSQFVVLPMDMDFMGAGTPSKPYPAQLAELRQMMRKSPFIKKHMLPFVAADPRRIAQQPDFFKDHIQQPIIEEGFRGIKLYPPLGYYPFDEHLLETMLWACENEVPITTHCIKGVIFYRGNKQKDWNHHPIFEKGGQALELRSFKNSEFCHHFTHPLNYECLLQPDLLANVLRLYNNPKLNTLYGFDPNTKILQKDLRNLKICFAHFGGEDEWERFLTRDKGDFEVALHKPAKNYDPEANILQYWHSVSWFSIIYNMLLRFPNTYADISFTLHDERTFSLLKLLLENSPIADRILFGTDFYVVRQKKNEKVLWTDLKEVLGDQNFEKIAITNPTKFLSSKYVIAP